jgi:hypothetical protein
MGVINFITETPDALRATIGDIKNDGPIVGVAVDGTKRIWGRLVSNLKSIGKDVRR